MRTSVSSRALGAFANLAAWPWLGAALVLGEAACGPDRTMLVVRVESDLAIPDAMDSVRVVVTHAGKTLQSLPFALRSGTYTLPLDVGLLSPSGGGADVEIDVSGSLGSTFVVGQDAITSFIKGKSLVLDMFLAAACVSFDCHDPNKTCTKGQLCVDKNRVADMLPAFDPHPPNPPRDGAPSGGGGEGDASDGPMSSEVARRGDSAGGGASGSGAVEAGPDARIDGSADRTIEAAPELVPGCVPKVEDCYNGLDDDCDGLNDCADPDCAPITVCVPRPSGNVGTTLGATDTCPKGFAAQSNNATPFGLTLDGGGAACTGCQCAAAVSTTSCTSALTTYLSTADCQAGSNGKSVATVSSTDANACPVPDTSTANVFGAALAPWTVTSSPCGPSGTPVRPTASFAASTGFCPAANVLPGTFNTGCPAGSACMRRPPAGDAACVLLADASACPAGTKSTALVYTGIQDNRSCTACSCDLQGASCANLVLQMGSDYGCGLDTADIHGGARTCTTTQTTGVYVPGYHLAGAPTNGTCKPVSALSGTLAPAGARSLCCLP